MNINRLYLFILLLGTHFAQAQQHFIFSGYQFPPLLYNPATAGQSEHTDLRFGYRSQWLGIDGAPNSQFLSIEKPLNENTFGGISFTNDQSGPLAVSNLAVNYAYSIPFSNHNELRLGIAGSVANWRSDWSKVTLKEVDDPSFQVNIKRWLPNAGAGMEFTHRDWQFALGIPQLLEYTLQKESSREISARTFRHFYLSGQRVIALNRQITLIPRFLAGSSTGLSGNQYGSPTAADLGLGVQLMATWYGGISWRTVMERRKSSDRAISLQAGYSRGNLRISAAYDISLNALQRVSAGSFEIMAGYQFAQKKELSPDFRPPVIKSPEPVSTATLPPAVTPKPVISPAETQKEYAVKGIIFDMTTGLPAENARVTITNTCGAALPEAYITGPDGRYIFVLQMNCCYQITAQKDGFKAGISNNICTNNPEEQSLRADLDLEAGK